MAGRGNSILVSSNPKGKFTEGRVSGTPKPGTAMQIKASSGIGDDGRFTYEVYNPGADGEQRQTLILLSDADSAVSMGRPMTEAFVDGDRVVLYSPFPDEELNILKMDVAGTGDDIAFGDMLIPDSGTGKFIKSASTPEMESFQALETLVDPTADVLIHAKFTGA
jgi:hypothetical protein